MPSVRINFELSDIKRTHTRKAFTWFQLLANIGGYNFTVKIIPTLLMSWYSSKMFQSSLYEELPVKKKKSKTHSQSSLQNKLASNQTFSNGLR